MSNTEVSNRIINGLLNSNAIQSCLNCISWDKEKDQCDEYKAKPPAQIIVYSCGPGWEADIPF